MTAQQKQDALWNKVSGGDSTSIDILGEVVTWTIRGKTSLSRVRASLELSGFDPKAALEFSYRNAFARAKESLEEGRVIRTLSENSIDKKFQFTSESVESELEGPTPLSPETDGAEDAPGSEGDKGARYAYRFETILRLDKKTGEIVCPKEELRQQAVDALSAARTVRTANDVTNLIRRLFLQQDKETLQGDLWPIRPSGAVYFVMASQSEFLDRIEKLVEHCGGTMSRLPIPMGDSRSNKTVQEVVSRGLGGLVDAFDERIDEFSASTKDGTFTKAAKDIRDLQAKIELYADYLGNTREKLLEQLAAKNRRLKSAILSLSTSEESPVSVPEVPTASIETVPDVEIEFDLVHDIEDRSDEGVESELTSSSI